MPKTINTPRDELICGKLDRAIVLLTGIEKGEKGIVDLAYCLHDIRRDADRMEAALIRRKDEVAALSKELAHLK